MEDLGKVIQNLNPNKAYSHDNISIYMLKIYVSSIYRPLKLISIYVFVSIRVEKEEHCSYHRTIIQTGITCKKISCYMRDSGIMLNIFEFSHVKEIVES